MSDDGYDSMDAEREREWRRRNPELASWGDGEADEEEPDEPPCAGEIEPERHDHEILVSGESHDPVGLICSCGKRYRVVPE